MALFDTFDSDLDDIAARCADEDAGVRRVAVLELAEVTDERAVPLLVRDCATRTRPCARPRPRRSMSTPGREWSVRWSTRWRTRLRRCG